MDTAIATAAPAGGTVPARIAAGMTPALFADTRRSARRFWELFGANIRNANTRRA